MVQTESQHTTPGAGGWLNVRRCHAAAGIVEPGFRQVRQRERQQEIANLPWLPHLKIPERHAPTFKGNLEIQRLVRLQVAREHQRRVPELHLREHIRAIERGGQLVVHGAGGRQGKGQIALLRTPGRVVQFP